MQDLLLLRLRDRDPPHDREMRTFQAWRLRGHRGLGRQGLYCPGTRFEDSQPEIRLRAQAGSPLNRRGDYR